MIPQVNTVAEAQHAISSAKFGDRNHGTRSAPPFRLTPGVSDKPSDPSVTIHENLNRQAAVMIQIETREAIDNLDDILTAVPDIDIVWLGTLDVRVTMGLASMSGPEPEFAEVSAKFASILKKHNKPRGGVVLGSPEAMKKGGKDNCINFTAVDVMGFMQMADTLPAVKKLFPPKKMMVDAPTNGEMKN